MATFVLDITGTTDEEIGLKEFIGERTYRDLTDGGQDKNGDQAILDAKRRIEAKYLCQKDTVANMTPDWTDQRVIYAALNYASYALYAKAENENIAADKRRDGNQVLSAIIGVCAFDVAQGDGIDIKDIVEIKTELETPPTIVVSAPTRLWPGEVSCGTRSKWA